MSQVTGCSVQEPGYDEAEYRTVYSDLIEPSASSSQFEVDLLYMQLWSLSLPSFSSNIDFLSQVDRRLQDLAAPVINRVVRAAHQLVQGWTLWLKLNIHVAVECSNIVPSWRVTPKCEVQTLRKEDWQSKCSYGWQRNTMKRIVKQERLYLTVSITYIDQKSSVKEELEYKLC